MQIIYKCNTHNFQYTPICPICKTKNTLTNHRTTIKIILNPILRKLLKRQIVSLFDQNDKFIKYEIHKLN